MEIRLIRYLPSIVWMGVIFYLSHQPATDSAATSRGILLYLLNLLPIPVEYEGVFHTIIRKSAHFMAYLILAVLIYFAYRGKGTIIFIYSMFLIFILLSLIESDMNLHSLIRKSIHFFVYTILSVLVYLAYQGRRAVLFTLSVCLLYAITDEFHQLFIPGRSGEIRDVLIDFSGAVFGIILVKLFMKIKSRRELNV
ncbi:MAG TPA: VanZ family protein [Pseudogracilibacillus sp.]|nr:VanZ family protein [Pseudogracilibacillus sp.]